MPDIVEQLRMLAGWRKEDARLLRRAADEIRRLRAVLEGVPQEAMGLEREIERLRAELEKSRLDLEHAISVSSENMRSIQAENADLRAEVDALRATIGNLDITGGGVCAAREVVKQFDAEALRLAMRGEK